MVTSSAVVGSSATSSLGWQASAHGDHDALLHAAAELMRIVVEPPCRIADADPVERGDDFRGDVAHVGPVQLDGLADLVADGEDRVERGAGLLEDVGDLRPAQVAQLIFAHAQDVAALELDAAGDVARRRRGKQAREGQRADAFAAAALAHDGERFAGGHGEGNAVDGLDRRVRRAEVDAEIFNVEQGRHGKASRNYQIFQISKFRKGDRGEISKGIPFIWFIWKFRMVFTALSAADRPHRAAPRRRSCRT